MDKVQMLETIITTRLLSGNTSEFVTELKQSGITSDEARAMEPFGDSEIGKMVATILDKRVADEAMEPSIGELQEYLRKSEEVTTKELASEKPATPVEVPTVTPDNMEKEQKNALTSITAEQADLMLQGMDKLAGVLEKFSEKFESKVTEPSTEVKAPSKEPSEIKGAGGEVIETLDPNKPEIEFDEGNKEPSEVDMEKAILERLKALEDKFESMDKKFCEKFAELEKPVTADELAAKTIEPADEVEFEEDPRDEILKEVKEFLLQIKAALLEPEKVEEEVHSEELPAGEDIVEVGKDTKDKKEEDLSDEESQFLETFSQKNTSKVDPMTYLFGEDA